MAFVKVAREKEKVIGEQAVLVAVVLTLYCTDGYACIHA